MFQRSYSWTSHEVGQLMSDLWQGVAEARARPDDYGGLFIGSLVVVDGAAGRNGQVTAAEPKTLQVIDGKQRLTTLTILLAALRDELGARGDWINGLLSRGSTAGHGSNGPARLMLGVEEDTYFALQVHRLGATREPIEPHGDSIGTRCIRECQQTIIDDLEDRSDEELIELAEFLRDRVALSLISAPDIDTGFRVFLTVNHRGKPLTASDILKAELMNDVAPAEREPALEQWRKAEQLLGDDFDQLPGYLRMVHGGGHGATIREVLEIVQKRGGARQFLDSILFPVADALYLILNAAYSSSPHAGRINRALRMLTWLKARDWVAPALAFACRFPDRLADFAVFLDALERLAYGLQIVGTGGPKRVSRYREVIDGLSSGMPLDGSQGPLALIIEEQGKLLLNATGNLYDRNSTNCKYLLKRISASYAGDTLVESLTDVSIEHVLPTNPPEGSTWQRAIADPVERLACNKLLGNLVLVSKAQNKDAGSLGLDAKLRIFFPGGQPSQHAITNQIRGTRSWNALDIRTRDDLLVKRIRQIWNISDRARPVPRRQSRLN